MGLAVSLGLLALQVTAQNAVEISPDSVFTNVHRFSLEQVIQMAKQQSPSYQQAVTQLENRTWQYQTYKSNYLPQLKLNATLPDYTKSINPVVQPSGTIEFRKQHLATTYTELALSQNIGLTGGVVSVNTNLKRIDDFLRPGDVSGHSYSSAPAVITLSQPLFRYNDLKWDRRIEPLRFEEAKRSFWEEMERISIRATDLYFNQLQSQISYDIATKNVANNDTLFKIAQARFYEAKISVNELLQLELSLLTSRQSLEQAKLDIETSTLRLRSYLGITDDYPIRLTTPDAIPQFEIDEEFALQQALENRSRILGIKREELEAERNMDRARGNTGVNANLYLQYGLVQQSNYLGEVYQDPSEQQRVVLTLSVPIMDWGRTKSQLGTAMANQKLVKANLEQQRANFEQDVYLQIKRFKMLREQMKIAQQANGLAERRYLGAKDRYLSGKIGILELNQAATERDSARRRYVSSLNSFWDAYYNIRLQTLYDFELKQPLLLTPPLPF